MVVELCVSYLLDQCSLILELVLGCVRTFSVGCIQTRHTEMLPAQVFVRLWWVCLFLWFHLSSSIHWLSSRQLLNFDNFWWIVGDWFINFIEDCSFWWVSIFINITEVCSFYWGYRIINNTEESFFCWGFREAQGEPCPIGSIPAFFVGLLEIDL